MNELRQFTRLCEVVDLLLGDSGCAWDRAQTHRSLRNLTLEEAYEVADAVDQDDAAALEEELGDLLLHVVMHSRIAQKNGDFDLAGVVSGVVEKLIRRHSHIFGSDSASSPSEVERTWEVNKNKEKAISSPLENMLAVPNALPSLAKAEKVIKRSDFDFGDCKNQIVALLDELDFSSQNLENEDVCGRIFLLLTAISTKLKINAEFSLTKSTQAFINDFRASAK